jgi:hypothetical protein
MCALLFCGWKRNFWLLFSGRNMDQRVLAWQHWSNVFFFCTGMAILLKIGSNVFGCSHQWDQVFFFCKRQTKSSLFVGENSCADVRLPLGPFLHFFICLPEIATWNFLSPGKTQGKFSLVAPRGCWCGPTPGELPPKGKNNFQIAICKENPGPFLGPFLAARCVSSISTSYSVHQGRSVTPYSY